MRRRKQYTKKKAQVSNRSCLMHFVNEIAPIHINSLKNKFTILARIRYRSSLECKFILFPFAMNCDLAYRFFIRTFAPYNANISIWNSLMSSLNIFRIKFKYTLGNVLFICTFMYSNKMRNVNLDFSLLL